MNKSDMRKQLEAGMAIFLSEGKTIQKSKPRKQREVKAKEKVVEIEVQYLPTALQKKYFGE